MPLDFIDDKAEYASQIVQTNGDGTEEKITIYLEDN